MIIIIEDENVSGFVPDSISCYEEFFYKHRHFGCDVVFRVNNIKDVPDWLVQISNLRGYGLKGYAVKKGSLRGF